jgi:hypothetical protein
MLNPVTIVAVAFIVTVVAHNLPPVISGVFLAGFAAGALNLARKRIPRVVSRVLVGKTRRRT